MLCNNSTPMWPRTQELVVYGGRGKAARNWPSFERIVETLKRLETTRRCRAVR